MEEIIKCVVVETRVGWATQEVYSDVIQFSSEELAKKMVAR